MKKIRAVLTALAVVIAMAVGSVTTMADGYNYTENEMYDLLEMLRVNDQFMIIFDPTPGEFTEAEVQSGMRTVDVGSILPYDEFPYPPVRYGYSFDGWTLDDERIEGDLEVTGFYILQAIWVANSGETGSETGNTAATPTPTPAATTSPTPTPSPGPTSSPTPTPAPSAGSPNPTTSPITVSLMIFGAVTALGITAYSIISLSMKQSVAVGKYQKNAMRYKRESRLESMLGVGNKKVNDDE